MQYDIASSKPRETGIKRGGKIVYTVFANISLLNNSTWTDYSVANFIPNDVYLAWIDLSNSIFYASNASYPVIFLGNGDARISMYLHVSQRKIVAYNSHTAGNLNVCIRYIKNI